MDECRPGEWRNYTDKAIQGPLTQWRNDMVKAIQGPATQWRNDSMTQLHGQGPAFGATSLNETHKTSIGLLKEIVVLQLIQNITNSLVNVCNK